MGFKIIFIFCEKYTPTSFKIIYISTNFIPQAGHKQYYANARNCHRHTIIT